MSKLTLHSPEYDRLLHRYNELDAILYPTWQERTEKRLIGDRLDALEMDNDVAVDMPQGASGMAQITTDYEAQLEYGNGSGVEG